MHRGYALLQIATVLVSVAYLLARKDRNISWVLQFVGLTFIWLMAFNVYAVRYIYYPGFVLFLVGAAMMLGNSASAQRLEGARPTSDTNPNNRPLRTREQMQ